MQSLERSLALLGLTKLTVAQIHEVNMAGWERIVEKGGTLEGLRAAQQQGLCDFIGVTGRAIPLLARLAATGEFDSVLCYHDYHPCVQLAAEEVLPSAAQSDMGVVLATVLAGGMYVAGKDQRAAVERRFEREEERQRAWATISRLEQEESTLPQSAFRWVLADERGFDRVQWRGECGRARGSGAGWGYDAAGALEPSGRTEILARDASTSAALRSA